MASPRPSRTFVESNPLLEHLGALPAAVIETDEDGTIRMWAGAAERLFGWTAAEVLGSHIDGLELVHESDLAFVDAVVDRVRSGHDRHLVHRNRNRTRSGEVRHCEWTRIAVGRPGQRPAILSYVVDVTTQVEAETSALTARADLDRWLRANPEGCCGLDREWRITHWNPAAERMLERSRAEVLGRELWAVFPGLRGTAFHRAFDEALADGHLRVVEERAPRGRVWYGVTAVPSGRGLYVFFSNVTGRRQLEQELLTLDAAAHRQLPGS
ncbi:MAG TPA: PAS domain-containing protein [Myxococcaceae bacterium]|nr:PAS domain-containing protein [Myxococcaceae bacterium]